MATRRQIRDSFLNELQTAAVGTHTVDYGAEGTDSVTVEEDDIGLVGSFDLEDPLPKIVYREAYRALQYNGAGAGPHFVERDSNGDVIRSIWREYIETQYVIEVRTADELQKEIIYETVRAAFGKYQFGQWNESDIHSDVFHVEVLDAQDTDDTSAETPVRGETLEVRISFTREFALETDGTNVHNIAQINREVDADLDSGTAGLTSTTT